MKGIAVTLLLILCTLMVFSQNINKIEYFLDTDPGAGAATSVTITASPIITDKTFSISLSAVPDGFHTLYIRAGDANGYWSPAVDRPFYKIAASTITQAPNIAEIEYFLDTDPGAGAGTDVAITAGQLITDKSVSISMTGVPDGFHTLYFRARDANGNWSPTIERPFYKIPASSITTAPNITRIEYFIDTDPGTGAGSDVAITAGKTITDKSVSVSLTGVSDGFHTLYFRTQDANGKWSSTIDRPFYKIPASSITTAPNITKIEYFVDTDPGAGAGTDVAITAGKTITDKSVSISLTGVSDGFHTLYFRTQDANGKWSSTISRPFYKIPAASIGALPNITKLEYFIDNDTGTGTDVPITAATVLSNLQFNVPLTGVSTGDHKLSVRARDANGKWSIVYATTFNIAPPPTITSFTPTSAVSGATVTLTGTSFANASAVKFGGVNATSFQVVSATSITAVVSTGASGSVSVTTPGGTGTKSGFTFIPAPTITSFNPASAGSGATVTITGTSFTNASQVSFGGVPAASFQVVSATSITAVVGSGATGNISVTTPGGTGTKSGFTFLGPPAITSFTPASGGTGTVVTISGTNFTGASAVSFGGTASSSFTVESGTSIKATVAAGASGSVSVTTPGGSDSEPGFTFTTFPGISAFNPTIAGAGTIVTITGSNFTGASSVSFGGIPATSFTVDSPGKITAVVGTGASGSVMVVTPSGDASLDGFTFSPPPTITSFTPVKGGKGSIISISGTNFTGAAAVNFGGVAATSFTVVSSILIQAEVNTGASGDIVVTAPGGTTQHAGFTFVPAPAITSFTPEKGWTGTVITISGTDFSDASAVTFGGVPASSYTVQSATSITAVVGNGGSGDVSVTTPGGVTLFPGFVYIPPPAITSLTPGSGMPGATVTITGNNLEGITGIQFNGMTAVFSVVSNTSATAVVPDGATTGAISIVRETTIVQSEVEFLVLPLQILSFSPTMASPGQIVNISGTGFSSIKEKNLVKFNNVNAEVKESSPTSLTVVVPNTTKGKITVTVVDQTATSLTDFIINKLRVSNLLTPEFFEIGKSGASVEITVNDINELLSLSFTYRGITEDESEAKVIDVPFTTSSNTINYEIPSSAFTDPIGLRGTFALTEKLENIIPTPPFYTYLKFESSRAEQKIPDITAGSSAAAYQLISVPLDLDVEDFSFVFKDLGEYDDRKWRVFAFQNENNIEKPARIVPGQGYWLITRDKTNINPGGGNTVKVTPEAPFEISINKGWNLIGNPYNFTISWDDIIEANGLDPLEFKFRQFLNGGFKSEPLLKRYRGAFVFSESSLKIKIPTIKHSSGGRTAKKRNPIDDLNWEVDLNLSDGTLTNELPGFGMNKKALEEKDIWDELALPLIEGMSTFDLKFREVDQRILVKDFVPSQENYTWNADLTNAETVNLSWNNDYFGDNDKQLFLEISDEVGVVDMRKMTEVQIAPGKHLLRFHYGSDQYVKQQVLETDTRFGKVFPNPVKRSDNAINLTVSLPEGTHRITMELFDCNGRTTSQRNDSYFPGGRQTILWQINFSELSSGLYLAKIMLHDVSGKVFETYRKVILE